MLGACSVAPMLSRASLLTCWADATAMTHDPGCELLLVVRVTNGDVPTVAHGEAPGSYTTHLGRSGAGEHCAGAQEVQVADQAVPTAAEALHAHATARFTA